MGATNKIKSRLYSVAISENSFASSKGRSGIINPDTLAFAALSQKFLNPKFNRGLK